MEPTPLPSGSRQPPGPPRPPAPPTTAWGRDSNGDRAPRRRAPTRVRVGPVAFVGQSVAEWRRAAWPASAAVVHAGLVVLVVVTAILLLLLGVDVLADETIGRLVGS